MQQVVNLSTGNPKYRYLAFISYSSKDAELAVRFHRALEGYRIPRDLVGRPGRDGEPVPRTLFPIFRDRDELPLSSDLGGTIHDALAASRYLIVICSPTAAKSRWVNEEIRYFKSLGRQDAILAIIASGKPNASDSPEFAKLECFPRALRHLVDAAGEVTEQRFEPIGGDLRPGGDGWKNCLLKAIAGITGLGLNLFTKREQLRQRRRRTYGAIACSLIITALVAWWDYARVKVVYFAHVTERFGVPEGTNPLDEETVRHRSKSYRVESSRQKVRRVTRVNSSGTQENDEKDFSASTQEIIYREDGSLEAVVLKSRDGQLVARRKFTVSKTTPIGVEVFMELKSEAKDAPLSLVKAKDSVAASRLSSSELDDRSDVSVYRIIYSTNGLPERLFYLNAYRVPRPLSGNVFGQEIRYDENRLPVRFMSFGYDQQPTADRLGVALQNFERDKQGDLVKTLYQGRKGELVLSADKMAGLKSSYDAFGNEIERTYLDVSGRPAVSPALGYATMTLRYDVSGRPVETFYFDTKRQAVLSQEGYARATSDFDENGDLIRTTYFDSGGNRVINKDGYSRLIQRRDANGDVIESVYQGKDDKPIFSTLGYAKKINLYDSRGYLLEQSYFGLNGELTLNKDGVAIDTYRYDENGKPIEISHFGTRHEPVLNVTDQTFCNRLKFDEHGNLVEILNVGLDGKLVLSKAGEAGFALNYDEFGNLAELTALGVDGSPEERNGGISRTKYRYDQQGNEIELAVFTTDGQPTVSPGGFWKKIAVYDQLGQVIERFYLGPAGRPIADSNGIASTKQRYDGRGNVVQQEWFDTAAKPAMGEDGWSRAVHMYDDYGHMVESQYYGTDSRAIASTQGFARETATFDGRGNLVESAFFDVDGDPTYNKEGAAVIRVMYDERDQVIEKSFFGLTGKPALTVDGYARMTQAYDEFGHAKELAYFGLDGQPVLHREGYARSVERFDERHRSIEGFYYGVDGQLILADGYAHAVTKYDERDNIVDVSFFGTDGKPVPVDGGARVKMQYDDHNRMIAVTFFNEFGQPAATHERSAQLRKKYDDRGRLIESINLDETGRPALVRGFFRASTRYDLRGHQAEVAFFGVNGELVMGGGDFARKETSYNARGQLVEEALFGDDDKPVLNKLGFSRGKYEYDGNGRMTSAAFFGTSGNPILSRRESASRVTMTYDVSGRNVENAWFGVDGQSTIGSAKVARFTFRYDEADRKIETAFYGTDGRLMLVDGHAREQYHYDERGRRLTPVYLNLEGQPVTLKGSVVILEIFPGYQAARLGLRVGDIILRFAERAMTSSEECNVALRQPRGENSILEIQRGKEVLRFKVEEGRIGVRYETRTQATPNSP